MNMSSRTPSPSIGKAQSNITPVTGPVLQRKCACGNHTIGGGECRECSKKKRLGLQTKLKVNEPGDIYEQEADRITDQVMSKQAHPAVCDALPRIQRYTGHATGQIGAAPASVDSVLSCSGRPLEPALRQDMEQRFGRDFSRVRVHSGAAAEQSARDVNALAYTVGYNIVFSAGRFVPASNEGQRLLAHELTHVVQQSGGDGTGLYHAKHDPSLEGQQASGITDKDSNQKLSQPITASVVALQRNSDDDLAKYGAQQLNDYVTKNPSPYKKVIEDIHFWAAKELDDNVAAAFTELQSLAQLEKFASTQKGREMLDVLYNAMMTGHVTTHERLQSDRILFAKWRWSPAEVNKIAQLHDPDMDAPAAMYARKIADNLNDYVARNVDESRGVDLVGAAGRYRYVIKTVQQDSSFEDDIASRFIVLQSPDRLEKFATNKEGRAMLDVLYEALITGDVTDFERLQAERILAAKAKTSRVPTGPALTKAIKDPAIFPLATAWGSTATIHAELLPNGKVKMFYDSSTGLRSSEFTRERTTLYHHYGESAVFNGIILDPDEPVIVKLFDQGGSMETVPAIRLIDFFNQQKEDTLGKIKTVAIMGATVGLGGIGAGGILGWADTITFAINAGSLFVNTYRNEIAKTELGRRFLEAWDVAEGVAEYYNWGRLGVDGLRLIHAKVSPAFERWRQETPTGVTSVEREMIAKAQQQTEAWLDAVKKAESAEAAKYLEAHPPKKVEGESGHRHADIEGGHKVKEVSGGLGCKFYSGEGIDVLCPDEFEHTGLPKREMPAKPSVKPTEAAREADKGKVESAGTKMGSDPKS